MIIWMEWDLLWIYLFIYFCYYSQSSITGEDRISFLFFRGILDFSLFHLYSDIDATYSRNEEDIRKYRLLQLERRIILWKWNSRNYSLNSGPIMKKCIYISRLITKTYIYIYLQNLLTHSRFEENRKFLHETIRISLVSCFVKFQNSRIR